MKVTVRSVQTTRGTQLRGYIGGRLVKRFANAQDAINWGNKQLENERLRAQAITAYKTLCAK